MCGAATDLAASESAPRLGQLARLHQQLQDLSQVALNERQVDLVVPVLWNKRAKTPSWRRERQSKNIMEMLRTGRAAPGFNQRTD